MEDNQATPRTYVHEQYDTAISPTSASSFGLILFEDD